MHKTKARQFSGSFRIFPQFPEKHTCEDLRRARSGGARGDLKQTGVLKEIPNKNGRGKIPARSVI
jgi:hypothetical protein